MDGFTGRASSLKKRPSGSAAFGFNEHTARTNRTRASMFYFGAARARGASAGDAGQAVHDDAQRLLDVAARGEGYVPRLCAPPASATTPDATAPARAHTRPPPPPPLVLSGHAASLTPY